MTQENRTKFPFGYAFYSHAHNRSYLTFGYELFKDKYSILFESNGKLCSVHVARHTVSQYLQCECLFLCANAYAHFS